MNVNSATWRKSSYSGGSEHGSCVEVAPLHAHAGVRDSKDHARGHLEIDSSSWAAFLAAIKL